MAAILHSDGRVEILRDVVGPGDPRLVDAREPDAHASTHEEGGSDPIIGLLDPRARAWEVGLFADRPAPAIDNVGRPYLAIDTGQLYVVSTGGAWIEAAPATAHATSHGEGGADPIAVPLDPRAYPLENGVLADRPAASISTPGRSYYATDWKILYLNNSGGSWEEVSRGSETVVQAADVGPETAGTLTGTDLTFGYEGNAAYLVDLMLVIRSGAAATGMKLAWDTSTLVVGAAVAFSHVLSNSGTLTGGDAITDSTPRGISSGVDTVNVDVPVVARGLVQSGGVSGSATLKFAAELASVSGITFKAKSVMRVTRVG